MREYTARFRQLCTLIPKMGEDEQLDRFVRGLRPRIRQEVKVRGPETFAEAIKIAERLDVNLEQIYGSQRTFKPPLGRFVPRMLPSKVSQTARPANGPAPMELGGMAGNKGGPPNRPGQINKRPWGAPKPLMCYWCGSEKHKAFECSERPCIQTPWKDQSEPMRQGNAGWRSPPANPKGSA